MLISPNTEFFTAELGERGFLYVGEKVLAKSTMDAEPLTMFDPLRSGFKPYLISQDNAKLHNLSARVIWV